MYVTDNIFQSNAFFVDLDDVEFFNEMIKAAIWEFEHFGGTDDAKEKERIKKYETPVVYYSTVSSKRSIDDIMTRKEMNTRGRRRFIMIDVDLEDTDWVQYKEMRKDLKRLAKEHNTYLLMYPTMSYPEKPRFRAVMFCDRLLDKGSHYQAVNWLYDNLGVPVSDKSDLYMSNNNAPKFVNREQIEAIYSNLDEFNPKGKNKAERHNVYEFLDNKLWRDYYKPKFDNSALENGEELEKTERDKFMFTDDILEKVIEDVINTESYMEYDEFWKLVHSLIRAEHFEQLSEDQIVHFLEEISKVAKDIITQEDWRYKNVEFYRTEKDRLTENDLIKTVPIINHKVFRENFIIHGGDM